MPSYARRREAATLPPADDEDIRQELARRHLLDFTAYTKPDYEANWHHRAICGELDALARGETTRLILCMPPRFGKSELASRRFPAYMFGRDPDVRIIACSHNVELARAMNRDVQRIIDSPGYAEVFSQTALFGSNVRSNGRGAYIRNADAFEIVGRRGFYLAAGVGGSITGRGCDIGVIDDVVKNHEEAASETYRERVWDWYTSTFYTRLEKNAKILVVMTRWHEDDLVGRLLSLQKSAETLHKWRVVCFPGISEGQGEYTHPEDARHRAEGDPLWPGKYSRAEMDETKAVIGSRDWAGLYQQRPSPAEGAIFLRGWWRYWKTAPEPVWFDEIVQSWDCTFKDTKGTDYVVGQVWGRKGANRYLLDQCRDRMNFPKTVDAIRKLKAKWPSSGAILVEDAANGPAVVSILKSEIPGLIPVSPKGGKAVRAHAITAQIEAGNVYIPSPEAREWSGDFIEECAAFPNGKHDDQVDAMTQALSRLSDQRRARWV
jgi:predicted phage terminase large subunit-like protein